ncbi:MAG TPA: antitoxin Xre-like helix-turn-helix domain-containing protein [Candidatus Baltobacteraceae bacterium]|jgi:hypothetical protein
MTAIPESISSPANILRQGARASGPALRTFTRIAELWDLKSNERQRVLGVARSTYFAYLKEPDRARLSADTLERISYVLGIYKALQVLLPRREAADAWIRRANSAPVFNGNSPLELMLGGKVADLYLVRRYLDGERGW